MVPMALALGEGAEATAPLGRAVIGGLAAATVATLFVLPSVYSLVQQSASRRLGVARSGRSGERLITRRDTHETHTVSSRIALPRRSVRSAVARADACGGGGTGAGREPAQPGAADDRRRPRRRAAARRQLSLPGELDPYQSVAVYPRVTGFVKTIAVDRGSRVRAGELIATLEAPELVAQRAEAQSKLQAAEAQLAAARSKADADASTYDKLKAASATPGVVAGNDLVLAQKGRRGRPGQVAAAQQNVEAARQALRSIAQMEGYLRVTAPFAGVVTERNVHPGALVGPNSGAGATTPMLRLVDRRPAAARRAGARSVHRGREERGADVRSRWPRIPVGRSPARWRASRTLST